MVRALAALLIAFLLTGCGGASPRSGARSRQRAAGAHSATAVAPSPALRYRWLVPVQGPQPSIATENREPGSRAWRLPGPAGDLGGLAEGRVAGYVSEQAVSPGQLERVYVSAPGSRTVAIAIFRMGWYHGAGGRLVLIAPALPVGPQPPCAHDFRTGLTECDWHPALSVRVPPALPTGVYIIKLSARTGESDCLFVVRSARPQPLVAQLPTSTYEAYNAWGGDSLYPGGTDRVGITGTTQGVEISYDRPYDSATGAGEFFARDVAMVRFLERYGYPVAYTTSESVDHDPGQLLGARAVIDFGHSEYWSERQAGGFARVRDRGRSLLFLGSDTMAWRIRYARATAASSQRGEPDHVIIAYKEYAALDPDRAQPSGPFPDGGAALTGSAYLGCITPRLNGSGPPTYRYYAWHPSTPRQPAWLFAHTGISSNTSISGVVGYELDMRTARTPPDALLVGSGTAPCMAAERREPHPRPAQDLAETTLYRARSGAIVFNTGTLGWELALEPVPSASPDAPRKPDRRVVALTRNLLARVLAARRG